ncbi:hypothetical protein MPSEU_000096500 [Mayamaea pseudoterrestris]|nr:hypothetical protein MPSEU_000096500 [Mayamaea pseudoterrestris]
MDVEQLHVVLQQSFAADPNLRNPAEETIKNLKHLPGAVQLLLQVIAEKQVRFEVRQAAAIQLKNICREGWAERVSYAPYADEVTKPSLLSIDDKTAVKEGLITCLLDEPEKSIRDLLAETLHTVVVNDFPEKWPDLIPKLLSTIHMGVTDMPKNGLRVHNALLAIRKVCKRYEYKAREQRGPLNEIVNAAFPLLLPLAQELSNENQNSLEAAMMLKQILKIFWSSTQFFLPGSDGSSQNTSGAENSIGLARPERLQPWFEILTRVLKKPLPEASTGLEPRGQPVDNDARNAWPWWKLKKWTVQIMSRLISRYGIPSYADDTEAKEFALYFSQTVAPQFLGPVCETLSLRPTNQFCTDRVVHLCLTFVDLAVELSSTYKLLKPHLDFMLYQVCFPTMCLHQNDIECFENDPIEFVQKQNSPLADFYDPRMSAITLLTDLVKHRGQDVTQNLLTRMTDIIQRYMQAPADQKSHVEKDGALLVFGSLAKFLMQNDKYASQIEGLLTSSVFPDFNSPVSFLRYRACWMVQQFSDVKWSDEAHLRNLLEMVLNRLNDPALPVQIEASKALRFLIDAEGAEKTLLPVLPQMLNEYFRIMNEIGNDEVVSALQALLDKFGEHIEPHANALVTQLTNTFHQYSSAGEDEDDDDAALAAAQCLECVSTVLKGICGNATILHSLEPILVPLVLKILGNDGDFIEYLESALDILTFLTYFQQTISLELWQAFPLIYVAFDQWAYDYLNMMVPCVQSFITKGSDVFLSGTATLPDGNQVTYVNLVFSMASKTLTNERASESECRHALSLFMCILNHCPGKVDAYIPYMNEIVLGKLGQQVNAEVPTTRISIYQVLGSALYYNPTLELVELEKRGVTQQVLTKWMQDADAMNKWLPQKLTVLGLAGILILPTSALPPSMTGSLPPIIHTVVKLALKLKDDAEKGETDANEDFDESAAAHKGDEAVDLDQGFAEDEDVKNEVDEAYRQAIAGVTNWDDDMTKFLMGDWDEDGDDVDDDYVSPIDQIEELILLSDTLTLAFQREPEVYQAINSALPAETLANCQRLFQTATTMRAHMA